MSSGTLGGRVALITGASRGIGRGIAVALARAGANIVINYRRNEQAAEETTKEIGKTGSKVLTFQADVTQPEQVNDMVKNTINALGRLDILVSNAGIISKGNFIADTDISELRRVVDTHVFGAFNCVKSALPYMRQQKRGDILLISSTSALRCAAGTAPYAIAKSAVNTMARCLAAEELPNGIRVNVIAPGRIDTEMQRRAAKALTGTDNLMEAFPNSPFGRIGQPCDIGNLCAFLFSEQGGWITGQVIYVDGGEFTTNQS